MKYLKQATLQKQKAGWCLAGSVQTGKELCNGYKAPVAQMNKFWRAIEHHTENFRLGLKISVLIPHTNGKQEKGLNKQTCYEFDRSDGLYPYTYECAPNHQTVHSKYTVFK